jgi:hypothetical protein
MPKMPKMPKLPKMKMNKETVLTVMVFVLIAVMLMGWNCTSNKAAFYMSGLKGPHHHTEYEES